jgi:hypothetical protein
VRTTSVNHAQTIPNSAQPCAVVLHIVASPKNLQHNLAVSFGRRRVKKGKAEP